MDFFPTVKAFIDFFEVDKLQNESEILADRLAVVSLTELGSAWVIYGCAMMTIVDYGYAMVTIAD